ncbi:hypothetical protein P280DRAFT_471994 [Massarina eburnea CBS 473.64]|uniref:Zn(2)-C6 fungal-type domain-containing protein n=1 Tax=Massarina eburnea CBS 473.64 TaxID=1395130 RepID=A0A6A6RUA1_9PLEO|nr:hypothetical protein P280DRAFT_471994 [Massarina eburnea CBS 473.64]
MSAPTSTPHSPGSGIKPPGGRLRVISSCLTCRRRKVRCDHVHPVCGACTRGNHVCTYATDGAGSVVGSNGSGNRISKPGITSGKGRGGDVQARLERLEQLLEKAVNTSASKPSTPGRRENPEDHVESELDSQRSPSNSQTSQHGISSDNQDGTLLLDGEQAQFVSSLHYALLADEIQDIKALLGDPEEERLDNSNKNNLIHLLSLGRARIGQTLENLFPKSYELRDDLLDVYFTNVDPMVRITHNPTLSRRFHSYIKDTHPMSFAVSYAAVNSLPPAVVENRFGESKEDMLAKFELGVEVGLARANYLTTPSLEVFQAFIIWLTCITREEDMGKAWTLLGIAIRIALNQGLHRDPSLFPAGSWDVVTIELRRRTWHQVCHLEFRAAECKGQEPSISEDDYTTLLPRNIEDEDLVEGASPGPTPYDQEKFTTSTFQLVRFMGMRAMRRIIKSTYRLERRMMESGLHGTSGPDPAQELRDIYEQIRTMVNEMHEEKYRKYIRFCSPQIGVQRLTLGLSSLLEWRCYLLFWLRMPRAYRDVVFSSEIRRSIFEKSVNCIETINGATVDVDAARFQWHIGSHSAFQAIMHILSELRNPLFDAPDRERAIRALQLSRLLKEANHTKPWQAIKSMIDRVVGDNILSRTGTSNSESSSRFTSPRQPLPTSVPTTVSTTVPKTVPTSFTTVYPGQIGSPFLGQEALPGPGPTQMVGTTTPAQTQTVTADHTQFDWTDMNLNNIVGNTESGLGAEMPEFDFGFWGDPINFGAEQWMTFPTDAGFYSPWE